MRAMVRWAIVWGGVAVLSAGTTASIQAQDVNQSRNQQVVSANPFGLLLEFFNAEYERAVTGFSTAGLGGSFISLDEQDYVNADLFWRLYPQGTPLEGWAFGAKAGITSIPDEGTFFGLGFDTNWSWLMGKNDNFYVGVGFGLKRLFDTPIGTGDDADLNVKYIPTLRIVNVGFAF